MVRRDMIVRRVVIIRPCSHPPWRPARAEIGAPARPNGGKTATQSGAIRGSAGHREIGLRDGGVGGVGRVTGLWEGAGSGRSSHGGVTAR